MQDFTVTARLMSSPTLLDIAAQSIRPCSAALEAGLEADTPSTGSAR